MSGEQQRLSAPRGDELQLKTCLSPRVKAAFAASGPAGGLGSMKATFQNKNKQQTNTAERDNSSVCPANGGPGRAAQGQAWFPLVFGHRCFPPERRPHPCWQSARGFSSGWGFLKWSEGSGAAEPQRSPSPQVVKEPSLQKDLGGSLLLTCYSTEKREDGVEGEGGDTGEGGQRQLSSSKGLFCMRKRMGAWGLV